MNKTIIKLYNKIRRSVWWIQDKAIYYLLEMTDSHGNILYKIILKKIIGKRQLIGFYGECHIHVYRTALFSSDDFKKKYLAINSQEIDYLARYHRKEINRKSAWSRLDILIYNPDIPRREGAPSYKDVKSWVGENTRMIEVTNAIFMGYMPQHTRVVFRNNDVFSWGDKNLNMLANNDEKCAFTIDDLYNEDFYDKEYVNNHFEKSLKKLEAFEKKCTIKIADYIRENGRQRILYYSVTHPDNEVMMELSRRIAAELGVHGVKTVCEYDGVDLHIHGEVVYPSVAIGLGLEEKEYIYRAVNPGDYKDEYDFDRYVKEYWRLLKEQKDENATTDSRCNK